ncbi:hypothetical protein GCM10022281_24220 [Sphingomonas rosea]|uniref:TadE-like domain-containing protein n=1 Tax=Sphingomonas rosea TaxID=335605 RepID=A0ABP7UFE4_9SPHN
MLNLNLRSLRADQGGAAFVEFAIAAPLFVLMLTGGFELTNLALTHLRLNRAAETLADNASRIPTQVDEFDLGQVFEGVELQGKSIDLENKGRIILSSLEDNGKGGSAKGQKIAWQRCDGKKVKEPKYGREGKGASDNALKDGVGPPGRKVSAPAGTAVMYAEVVYDYEPILWKGIIPSKEIRYEAAFNVRERDQLGITNSKGKPPKTC